MTEPAWKQISALFARHGLPEPPTRLRDELVGHLLAARAALSSEAPSIGSEQRDEGTLPPDAKS